MSELISSVAERFRSAAVDGPGYVVAREWGRGLTDAEVATYLVSLGEAIGRVVPTRRGGPLIDSVMPSDPTSVRGAVTPNALPYHTDMSYCFPDAFILYAVRQAREGGRTNIADGNSIYHLLSKKERAAVRTLETPIPFDLDDGSPSTATGDESIGRAPVFSQKRDRLRTVYNRARIHRGYRKCGLSVPTDVRYALGAMESLLSQPAVATPILLRAGDVMIADNWRILHARESFRKVAQDDLDRLLLRLWIITAHD